jgi:hypothetical protein
MPRENRDLLVDVGAPLLTALVGAGVSGLVGVATWAGVLVALLLLSAVVVALAQQTLP